MIWGYHNFRKHPNSRPQKTPPTLTPSSHPKVIVFLPLHDWRKLYRPCSTVKGSPAAGKNRKKKGARPLCFSNKNIRVLKKQPTVNLPKMRRKVILRCFFFVFWLWSFWDVGGGAMLMFGLVTGDRTDRTDLKVGIRSLKLTVRTWKLVVWTMNFLLEWPIFSENVGFREGTPLEHIRLRPFHQQLLKKLVCHSLRMPKSSQICIPRICGELSSRKIIYLCFKRVSNILM